MEVVAAILTLGLALSQCSPLKGTVSSNVSGKQSTRESRILGGEKTIFGQHSWQVALFRKNSGFLRLRCGGSLIDETHVLTAAHCVHGLSPDAIIARLGEHDLTDNSEEEPYAEQVVQRVVEHENYHQEEPNIVDDIAILQLAGPVVPRKHITPIKLPYPGADLAGEKATIYGWGRMDGKGQVANTLRKIDVRVVDGGSCNKWLLAHGYEEVRGSFLCAGFATNGYGPCKGDSGGPMIYERNGRARIIGIVAASFGCGKPNSPIFYTEVSKYVEWITARSNASIGSRNEELYEEPAIHRINHTMSRKTLKISIVLMIGIILSVCILLIFHECNTS